jgi:hypothetical protein
MLGFYLPIGLINDTIFRFLDYNLAIIASAAIVNNIKVNWGKKPCFIKINIYKLFKNIIVVATAIMTNARLVCFSHLNVAILVTKAIIFF